MLLMEKMHALTKTWVVKAILTLLPISFLVSGMYGYFGSSADLSAVKVNGEEISQEQFQRSYSEETQRLNQQLGVIKFAALMDKPEFVINIRENVLNTLIDEELIRQYAQELNLSVSDDSIKRAIVSNPALQVNGKFSNEAYQLMLRNNGMSADMYAEYLRQALRLSQLQQGVVESDFMTPVQQELLTKGLLQSRTVRFATFPLAPEMAKYSVTDQEIQDYYNSHKNELKIPEMVKVQYIDLTKDAVANNINVTDVAIHQYYQDHRSEFMTKTQQRLAHIQFASEQDAQAGYQALQGGTKFEQLAQEKSEDKLSAVNGGDLGWINDGDLPKELENVAATLQVGNYSSPVNLNGVFHIVKVSERKLATEQPLEQVRDQISARIRQDLTATQFYTVERQVAEKTVEDPSSLNAAATVAGVKVQETAYFSRQEIPDALNFPTVVSAMFDGEISQGAMNSEPMNVGDQHSLVVRVVEHKMEGIKSLDEAKTEISQLLIRQKAEKVLRENVDKLTAQLQQDNSSVNVKFGAAEKWIYLENKDPILTPVIFAMAHPANGKSQFTTTQNKSGDIMIVALDAVSDGEPNSPHQNALNLQNSQAQLFEGRQNLLKSLRAKAKLEFNQDFLKQNELR